MKIVTDKNEVLSYKFDQVKQINTEKLNPKMDLWPQVQLLDKISVKGEDSDLVGFISSRTLGKELVIEFEMGTNGLFLRIRYCRMPRSLMKSI